MWSEFLEFVKGLIPFRPWTLGKLDEMYKRSQSSDTSGTPKKEYPGLLATLAPDLMDPILFQLQINGSPLPFMLRSLGMLEEKKWQQIKNTKQYDQILETAVLLQKFLKYVEQEAQKGAALQSGVNIQDATQSDTEAARQAVFEYLQTLQDYLSDKDKRDHNYRKFTDAQNKLLQNSLYKQFISTAQERTNEKQDLKKFTNILQFFGIAFFGVGLGLAFAFMMLPKLAVVAFFVPPFFFGVAAILVFTDIAIRYQLSQDVNYLTTSQQNAIAELNHTLDPSPQPKKIVEVEVTPTPKNEASSEQSMFSRVIESIQTSMPSFSPHNHPPTLQMQPFDDEGYAEQNKVEQTDKAKAFKVQDTDPFVIETPEEEEARKRATQDLSTKLSTQPNNAWNTAFLKNDTAKVNTADAKQIKVDNPQSVIFNSSNSTTH